MKCVVLDYQNGEIRILDIDQSQSHEVEEILTQNYEYSLENIEWILVENDKIHFGDLPSDWKMTQVSKEMAEYLFNSKKEVYILHYDGTESLAENIDEIRNTDELLGVEW